MRADDAFSSPPVNTRGSRRRARAPAVCDLRAFAALHKVDVANVQNRTQHVKYAVLLLTRQANRIHRVHRLLKVFAVVDAVCRLRAFRQVPEILWIVNRIRLRTTIKKKRLHCF